MTVSEKSLLNELYGAIESQYEKMKEWRRHLHQNPELSFEEKKTAQFIINNLEELPLELEKNIGGNGIAALLKGDKPGPNLAFRADFDALPIQDEKDVPYSSKKRGIMHACGHDGHTAALLGLVSVLSKYKHVLNGSIKFIFQHAEEKPPGGAKFMIEDGVLEGVDFIYGAHLASDLPLGTFAIGEQFQMAAVDKFSINIKGKGGHGARPHQTKDALVIGTSLVESLQKIVSRRVNPLDSAVVTVGKFQAGQAFNVIPEHAQVEGTVRTYNPEVRDFIEEEIKHISHHIGQAYHAQVEIDYLRGYPALFNHIKETQLLKELLSKSFGEEKVVASEPTMGAEDFAYYLLEKPGSYFRVGSNNGNESTQYPHHHPKFDFDEKALVYIGKAFIHIVNEYLIKGDYQDEA